MDRIDNLLPVVENKHNASTSDDLSFGKIISKLDISSLPNIAPPADKSTSKVTNQTSSQTMEPAVTQTANQMNQPSSQTMEPAVNQTANQMNQPSPPPLITDNTRQSNVFYIVRDRIFPTILNTELARSGLYLDSDVYRYDITGSIVKEPVFKNRHRLITRQSFKTADELDKFFKYWGKIPSFLQVKDSPGRGYGIFTNVSIKEGTFLGYYEGQYRPFSSQIYCEHTYLFNTKDIDGNQVCLVDGDNATFSNYIAYINDGDKYNVDFSCYNYQIYAFAKTDIQAGEELFAPYGEAYWKYKEKLGMKKL